MRDVINTVRDELTEAMGETMASEKVTCAHLDKTKSVLSEAVECELTETSNRVLLGKISQFSFHSSLFIFLLFTNAILF